MALHPEASQHVPLRGRSVGYLVSSMVVQSWRLLVVDSEYSITLGKSRYLLIHFRIEVPDSTSFCDNLFQRGFACNFP